MASAGMELFELAMTITESGTDKLLEHLELVNEKGKATNKTLGGIGSTLKSIGGYLIASATAGLLYEMGKLAVEDEQALVKLRAAVEGAGVSFAAWNPYIQQTIEESAKLSGLMGEEVTGALTRLITISGDVRGSLANLNLVLGISKMQHIELNEAASLVGRVMNGNVLPVYRQLGIHALGTADAIQVLRQRFGDFAGKDTDTLGGSFLRLKTGFMEMLEEFGIAIFNTTAFKDALKGLTEGFKSGETWIKAHKVAIADLTDAFVKFGKFVWNDILKPFFTFAYQGFQGLRIIVIEFTEAINQIPENFKRAWGETLMNFGNLLEQLGPDLIDQIFGTHLVDAIHTSITAAGEDMNMMAKSHIATLKLDADNAVAAIRNAAKAISKEVPEEKKVKEPAGGGKATPDFDVEAIKQQLEIIKAFIAVKKDTHEMFVTLTELQKTVLARADLATDLKTKAGILKVAADIQGVIDAAMKEAGDKGAQEGAAKAMVSKIGLFLQDAFKDMHTTIVPTLRDELNTTIESTINDTFISGTRDSIVNAFSAAFDGKGLKGVFSAFTKTILGYFGNMLIELGVAFLKFGKIMSALQKFLTNIFTAGPASVAIGVLLIALGASFAAIASHGGGGGSGGPTGAGYTFPGGPAGSSEYTRVTVGPTSAATAANSPAAPHVTNIYYGVDNPQGQRHIVQMYDNGKKRGING